MTAFRIFLAPVVTEPKKAIVALKWVVREMEDRYRKMSKLGVRNITGYNQRMAEARAAGEVLEAPGADRLRPRDRRAGLRGRAALARPDALCRRRDRRDGRSHDGRRQGDRRRGAAARANGPRGRHPSHHGDAAPERRCHHRHDQGEFPDARFSFQVTSKIDSRTILGEQGAEQLLGAGDMLYMAGGGRIKRVHGPFVSDIEVEKVVQLF